MTLTPQQRQRPRLVFFTGLGCDERMVGAQRGIAADVDFQPWIAPVAGESLRAYAGRMAARVDASAPFYLAGISMGGMVAQEVARAFGARGTPPRGLILLSSCRSGAGVPLVNRLVSRLVTLGPPWLTAAGKAAIPYSRGLLGVSEPGDAELFAAMLGAADDATIRWSLTAIAGWPGAGEIGAGPLDVPTLQVHGERDRVLPLRLAGPVDVVVPAAGHAATVTHAAEVNAAVSQWLIARASG